MRKVGKANLDKASGFYHERNFVQLLHYANLAATKLKRLKDRRLETVQLIDEALGYKFTSLQRLDRHRDAKECAEERYTMWAMNQMRNPGSIYAALHLIQSCLHNEEFEDAEHYARHAMFMINDMTDNFIPSDQRPDFLAEGSYWLSQAIHRLAQAGGIPPEDKQKAGEEAIALARQALKIHTRLHGAESAKVSSSLGTLAEVLRYFNDVDDDEILRLHEQSIVITSRVEGSSSYNVAAGEYNLGCAYGVRAERARSVNDLDRCMANLELALPHYREAGQIFRATNHADNADATLRYVAKMEEQIRQIGIYRAAAAAAAAAAVTTG